MNRENTDLIIGTNNLTRMTVTAGGNIGIGKYPTTTLDVNGSVAVNGEITNPSKTGSANMIPIAYGVVGPQGAILNGSGNFTVERYAIGTYIIEVDGEVFTGYDFNGNVFPTSHIITGTQNNEYSISMIFRIRPHISNTGFIVNLGLRHNNGIGQDEVFSFVIYKP